MTTVALIPGDSYRWEPGLQMDPDTGEVVRLLTRLQSSGRWSVQVVRSGRVLTVYPDELKAVEGPRGGRE